MKKLVFTALACLSLIGCLSGCNAFTAIQSGTPLTPAQVQQDLANATYLMQAAGCTLHSAAQVAAPLISIAGDAKGNQVLQAADAAGQVQCAMTVPASALPVPAPAAAPAVAVVAK